MGLFGRADEVLKAIDYSTLNNKQKIEFNILRGILFVELGEYKKAEVVLKYEQIEFLSQLDKNLYFLASIYRGILLSRTSRLFESLNYLNSLIPDILLFKNSKYESLVYNWIGNTYWLKGNMKECLSYHELALKVREQFGKPSEIAASLNNIGIVYRVQGKLRKAIKIFNKALVNECKDIRIQSILKTNLGYAYFELGDFNRALEKHIESYNCALESGSKSLVSDALYNIVHALYKLQDQVLLIHYLEKLNSLEETQATKSFKLMANAYFKMFENPLSAIENWKEVALDDSLEFNYRINCYEEILLIYLSENTFNKKIIFDYLDTFENVSKNNGLFSSLAKINFIKALIYKNLFEFEQAEFYLNKTILLSYEIGLPYHEQLARKELDNISEKMKKFGAFYQNKEESASDSEPTEIISYIQNFKQILSETFEQI